MRPVASGSAANLTASFTKICPLRSQVKTFFILFYALSVCVCVCLFKKPNKLGLESHTFPNSNKLELL